MGCPVASCRYCSSKPLFLVTFSGFGTTLPMSTVYVPGCSQILMRPFFFFCFIFVPTYLTHMYHGFTFLVPTWFLLFIPTTITLAVPLRELCIGSPVVLFAVQLERTSTCRSEKAILSFSPSYLLLSPAAHSLLLFGAFQSVGVYFMSIPLLYCVTCRFLWLTRMAVQRQRTKLARREILMST